MCDTRKETMNYVDKFIDHVNRVFSNLRPNQGGGRDGGSNSGPTTTPPQGVPPGPMHYPQQQPMMPGSYPGSYYYPTGAPYPQQVPSYYPPPTGHYQPPSTAAAHHSSQSNLACSPLSSSSGYGPGPSSPHPPSSLSLSTSSSTPMSPSPSSMAHPIHHPPGTLHHHQYMSNHQHHQQQQHHPAHPHLVSSSSQPLVGPSTPGGGCLTGTNSTSSSTTSVGLPPLTPLVPSGGGSYSAIQTPDSPGVFPRRVGSLTTNQRNNATARLQLDLKSHKSSPIYAKTSASTELIDKHSLSPRPRPKHLSLSNSQDNMLKQGFGGGSPASSSSRNHRPLPLSFGQPVSLTGPHLNTRSPHNIIFQNNIRLKDEFSRNNSTIEINGKKYEHIKENDFAKLSELGSGSFGQVEKMLHRPSNTELAVKKMRRSGNQEDNKHILNDLDLLTKCNYANIVQCYGYYIMETEVWIFMELMTTCFDRLLKKLKEPIPERIIGKVAVATISTLNYLKTNHNVIHRDIKPSNILINRQGIIKLCDFGISGRLIDSKAHSRSVGCTAYMAPERIEPPDSSGTYDIRSDVWSFGITLVEIATGQFPYKGWSSDFEILSKVIQEDPPSLPADQNFSQDFKAFIKSCLTKNYQDRPKYNELMESRFFRHYLEADVDVAEWFKQAYHESDTTYSSSSSLASISTIK